MGGGCSRLALLELLVVQAARAALQLVRRLLELVPDVLDVLVRLFALVELLGEPERLRMSRRVRVVTHPLLSFSQQERGKHVHFAAQQRGRTSSLSLITSAADAVATTRQAKSHAKSHRMLAEAGAADFCRSFFT